MTEIGRLKPMEPHSLGSLGGYAVDFLAPAFELHAEGFVAHPRAKRRPHWSERSKADPNQPSAVLAGRTLESVTVGKMPGRQVIVYNKRREAIAKRNLHWFEIWKINRADPNAIVWRVEVRAGKKELQRYNIRTFDDLETCAGDAIRNALDEVRYVAPEQGDSNTTRQRLDPLWIAMIEQVEKGLFAFRAGLAPSRIREIEREAAIHIYGSLILGNAAGLAVALGFHNDEIKAGGIYDPIRELIFGALKNWDDKFFRSVAHARERLHFIAQS